MILLIQKNKFCNPWKNCIFNIQFFCVLKVTDLTSSGFGHLITEKLLSLAVYLFQTKFLLQGMIKERKKLARTRVSVVKKSDKTLRDIAFGKTVFHVAFS